MAQSVDPTELLSFISQIDSDMIRKYLKAANSHGNKASQMIDGDFYTVCEMFSPEEHQY